MKTKSYSVKKVKPRHTNLIFKIHMPGFQCMPFLVDIFYDYLIALQKAALDFTLSVALKSMLAYNTKCSSIYFSSMLPFSKLKLYLLKQDGQFKL